MKIKLTAITWDGTNYIKVIQVLNSLNQELKVCRKGNRLVIRDDEAGFYRVFAIGDFLEVVQKICEPDEPIDYTEPVSESIPDPTPVQPAVWSRGGVWGEDFKTLGDVEPHLFP